MKFWKKEQGRRTVQVAPDFLHRIVDLAVPSSELGLLVPTSRPRRQSDDVLDAPFDGGVQYAARGSDLILDQRRHEKERVDPVEERR